LALEMAKNDSKTGSLEKPRRPTTGRSATGGSSSSSSSEWPLGLLREGNSTLISIILFALVAGVYWASLGNGFVNLDDQVYVYENLHVRNGLTWEGFRWAFTALDASLWHPFTWLSLMLDSQLFGVKEAWGFHLTSLVLHATNTVLLFGLLRRLTGTTWRSAFVAALFGLHPLHVESVAWVSERKDVLSTFFWLLALWAYVGYVQSSREVQSPMLKVQSPKAAHAFRSKCYALALIFFACGLLSKPMVVTLPFTLLFLDYWPLRRFEIGNPLSKIKNLLWEKIPFFALSLVFGLVTMYAQRGAGSFMTSVQLPISHRLANALLSYVHYLIQMVWPGRYAMYYPYPRGFSTAAVVLAVLLLLIPSAMALRMLRRRPYFTFGWVWYVMTLLPVIGIIQVGNQAQADRYTYVPLIGIFIILAWGAYDLSSGWSYQKPVLALASAAAIITCLGFTYGQIGYWKNSETLAWHALSVTQNNEVALNLMGIAESKRGRIDDAITYWEQAVALAPQYAHAQANLGAALFTKGRLDESIEHSRDAVRAKPDFAGAHLNLGAALGAKGRLDEAIAELKEGTRLAPGNAQAHYNLGFALASKGRWDDAIAQYQEAARLAPGVPAIQRALSEAVAAKAALHQPAKRP
jgi:tetratricopeptide (TPR) repeat protein